MERLTKTQKNLLASKLQAAKNAKRLQEYTSKGNKKRRAYCYYVCKRPDADTEISESGMAYLYRVSKIITTSNLKAVYAKSGNDYIRQILLQSYQSMQLDAAQENMDMLACIDYDLKDSTGKIRLQELNSILDNIEKMKNPRQKTWYSIEEDSRGEKHIYKHGIERDKKTGEIIPYKRKTSFGSGHVMVSKLSKDGLNRVWTLKKTEFGKLYLGANVHKALNQTMTDYDYLVSVAFTEFLALARDGVIVDYADVWQYRRLVYQALNREIASNRKHIKEQEAMQTLTYFDDVHEEQFVDIPDEVDDIKAFIDNDTLKAICKDIVCLSADENKERNAKILFGIAIGCDYETLADAMGLTVNVIKNVVRRAKKWALQSDIHKRVYTSIFE